MYVDTTLWLRVMYRPSSQVQYFDCPLSADKFFYRHNENDIGIYWYPAITASTDDQINKKEVNK